MTPPVRSPAVEDLLAQAAWARRLALRLVGDADGAEEVLQEAWVAALERPPQGPSLRAWLGAVVRNLALRRRRREAARTEAEQRSARREAVGGGQEVVERMQLQRLLAEALLELREPYRSAVILRHLDDLPAAEIARRQGCSVEAARQRVSRGLALLRAELDRRNGGDRTAWCAALVASWDLGRAGLPTSSAAGGAAVGALGGTLVGAKTIVAVTAGLGIGVAALVWTQRPDGSGPQPDPAPAVVAEPQVAPPAVGPADAPGIAPVASAEAPRAEVSTPSIAAGASRLLSGRVLDQRGAPLEGATVALLPAGSESASDPRPTCTSRSDGGFRLAVPAGIEGEGLTLAGTLEGYVPSVVELDPADPVELVLLERPHVRGRLLRPDGSPAVPPGYVGLRGIAVDGEEWGAQSEIDAQGAWVATDLLPGRLVSVIGRARGFGRGELEPDLELAPGAREDLDVVLDPGLLVRGVVVDAVTQAPVPHAEVWAEEWTLDADVFAPTAVADAEGRFELRGVVPEDVVEGDAPAGETFFLSVSARAEGFVGEGVRWRPSVRDPEGVCHVIVELQPATASVSGRVTWPDGSPGAGMLVLAIDAQRNPKMASTDADGTYRIEGLPAGPVTLRASTPPGQQADRRVAVQAQVDLSAGAEVVQDLVLAEPRCVLEGRVTDAGGAPLADVPVEAGEHLVAGDLTLGMGFQATRTDAQGRYRIEGLTPGRYRVEVSAEALVERAVRPEGRSLDLGPDGSADGLDFVLVPAVVVTGWVDPGTTPLDELELCLRRASDGEERVRMGPQADGAFTIGGLYPQPYELVLERDGQEVARVSVGPQGAQGITLAAPR